MKLLRFVAFLFYDYYSKGPRRPIKYFSTIGVMSLLFFINILGILAVIGVSSDVLPKRTDSNLWNFLRGGLILVPLYITLRYLIPEKSLKTKKYKVQDIKNGKKWLVLYFIVSMLFASVAILMQRNGFAHH
jgi:hypothetical protein